jgi:DNA-binding MarR family transcriptional regulator
MGYLEKFKSAVRNRTTYRAGLLQAKAYRILKIRTNKELAKIEKGISSIHWALLGILYDERDGMRPREAALELGVEAAFVTALVADLKKKGFVEVAADKEDSRAKRLAITTKGIKFLSDTEPKLRAAMRPLLAGISMSELMAYLAVLERIVGNSDDGSPDA